MSNINKMRQFAELKSKKEEKRKRTTNAMSLISGGGKGIGARRTNGKVML